MDDLRFERVLLGTLIRPLEQRVDDLRFERVSLGTLIDSPVFAGKHVKRIDLDPGSARPVMFDVFASDRTRSSRPTSGSKRIAIS